MATFAYSRVSTKDQSTENQRLDIEKAGFSVDYWFADEGISGKTHARSDRNSRRYLGKFVMVKHLWSQSSIDLVVMHKMLDLPSKLLQSAK